MRRGSVALMLILLGSMQVRAQDDHGPNPSKWSRFFHLPTFRKPARAEPEAKKEPLLVSRPVSQETLNQQARATLLRRQAAVQKFREIAASTGDPDLERKANQLDQRIWDFYLHKTGMPGKTQMSVVDQQVFDSQFGLNRVAGPSTQTGPMSTGSAQAATRKEMP